jgi:hypothetical protein
MNLYLFFYFFEQVNLYLFMSSWSVWTMDSHTDTPSCNRAADCVAGRQRATPKIHGMAAWASSQHDTWALGAGQQHW